MKITGKYEEITDFESDENFIMVYTDDAVYTIAKNAPRWGVVKVGERTFFGGTLTREVFEKMKAKCNKTGSFELPDNKN